MIRSTYVTSRINFFFQTKKKKPTPRKKKQDTAKRPVTEKRVDLELEGRRLDHGFFRLFIWSEAGVYIYHAKLDPDRAAGKP